MKPKKRSTYLVCGVLQAVDKHRFAVIYNTNGGAHVSLARSWHDAIRHSFATSTSTVIVARRTIGTVAGRGCEVFLLGSGQQIRDRTRTATILIPLMHKLSRGRGLLSVERLAGLKQFGA